MGISFDIKPADNLDLSLAYFRQAEPSGPGAEAQAGRYSYDIIPGSGAYVNSDGLIVDDVSANLKELDQFNGRLVWHFNENWSMGVSAQAGGIYNSTLDKSELSTVLQRMLRVTLVGLTLKQRLFVMIIMLLVMMVKSLMWFQWVLMLMVMPVAMGTPVG